MRILLATALLLLGGARPAAAVDFAASLDAAQAQAAADRPVVVIFSAPWCGWCRKLAATTLTDPMVAALQDRFVWVKVDADQEPALAARWQVRGLPHTVVLNAEGRLLGSQPGYMTADSLVAFLKRAAANRQPLDAPPSELLTQLDQLDRMGDPGPIVRRAVEALSQAEATTRAALGEALQKQSRIVSRELLELLADERLAVRAAAWAALQRSAESLPPFDPFGALETRNGQIATLRERFAATVGAPEPGPDSTDRPKR